MDAGDDVDAPSAAWRSVDAAEATIKGMGRPAALAEHHIGVDVRIGDGDFMGSALRETLRDAQAQLRALAEKHRLEQDVLIDRLLTPSTSSPSPRFSSAGEASRELHPCSKASPRAGHGTLLVDAGKDPHTAVPSLIESWDVKPRESKYSGKDLTLSDKWQDQAFHGSTLTRVSTRMLGTLVGRLEYSVSERVARSPSRWLEVFLSFLQMLDNMVEPERSSLLADFVDGKHFGALCILCISLNAIFLIYTTDLEMGNPDESTSDMVMAVECSFMAFYALELMLKFIVHRLYLFWCEDSLWNLLDFLLVLFSIVEMSVTFATRKSSSLNISFMRSFRLFKLAKVLRVFRSVRFFAELRLMFDCVLGSLMSLVWCLAMIMFVVYIFSLLIVQSLAQDLRDETEGWTEADVALAIAYFGSVGQSMLTLIKSTTGGVDWGAVFDLLRQYNPLSAWSFLSYIVFFALAAWNIVTSLFVERALKLAQPDIDTLAMESNMKDAMDSQEMIAMFKALDTDGSGRISLDEMRMLVSVAGDAGPEIDIEFIVAACLRMKGSASSMDLHALSFESKLINRRLRKHINDNSERLNRIERSLAALLLSEAPLASSTKLFL